MSWKPEITADDRTWTTNSLRFATEKEATDYVANLLLRWNAVRDVRIAACSDPVNYHFADGVLSRLNLR
jgi:hypothetical protein